MPGSQAKSQPYIVMVKGKEESSITFTDLLKTSRLGWRIASSELYIIDVIGGIPRRPTESEKSTVTKIMSEYCILSGLS